MERHSASVDDDDYWPQYDPPKALSKLPNITSETILAIIQSSVENVRTQIEVEKQRRLEVEASVKEEAEAEAAAFVAAEQEAAEARKEKGKARDDSPPQVSSSLAGEGPLQPAERPPPEAARSQKRHSRLGISRLWSRVKGGSEQDGESSRSISSSHHPPNIKTFSTLPEHPQTPAPFTEFVYKILKPPVESAGDTVECVSCFDDLSPKDRIKTICHYYCKDCFIRLIQTALDNEAQWPPKCCLNPVPCRTIIKHIPADLRKSYRAKDEEFRTPIEQRLYCSQPDCGLWIPKKLHNLASRTATCPSGHVICTMCRGTTHPADEACPQDRDTQLADRLAAEEGWRRCAKCSVLVEHREACQHMTCRCGHQFCYVCGAVWQTCRCTMEMLSELKHQATQRRQARQARTAEEELEARELTEALQLIAAFEAEEARREARRQAKAAKRREEARIKEAAERAQREEERRQALDKKYRELEGTLEKLNNLQRTVLSYAHDREMDDAVRGAAASRHQLAQKQEKERQELRASCKAKLAAEKKQRRREYVFRVLWEKQIEHEYETQLTEFWAGYLGGAADVKRAIDAFNAFRRKNDSALEKWHKVQDNEIARLTCMLDDEITIQAELAADAKRKLDERLAAEGMEMGRKHRAEGRWFELVTAERTRLLAEVEVLERENGGEEGSSAPASSDDGVEVRPLLEWEGENVIPAVP